MKKKILIVQPLLAHYRKSLFQHLVDSEEFDIEIIAGNQINNIREIDGKSPNIKANLENRNIRIGGHIFIWQLGVAKYTIRTKPDIVVLTGVDPHIVSNLYLSLVCRFLLNIKVIWWGHADLEKKGCLGKKSRLFFFNLSSGVLCYNEGGKKNIEKMARKRMYVKAIKNCINDEEYGYAQSPTCFDRSLNSTSITVLFSGRITKEKRLDVLIEALSILKQKGIPFKCFIIGEGKERSEIENQIISLQLSDSVELLGERYQAECRPYFNQSDLFVLPGKVGLSVIHALSYGLPVITSDIVTLHSPEYEIIQKGYNGDFFHKLDPKDLAGKIISWGRKVKNDRNREIKRNCISSVIEGGYTSESMTNKMIEFIKDINAS